LHPSVRSSFGGDKPPEGKKKIKEERDDHEVSEGIRVDISVERGQRDSGLVEVSPGKQSSFNDNREDVDDILN